MPLLAVKRRSIHSSGSGSLPVNTISGSAWFQNHGSIGDVLTIYPWGKGVVASTGREAIGLTEERFLLDRSHALIPDFFPEQETDRE
jgi:hypothetical protein